MGESSTGREYEAIYRHSAVPLWVEDISRLRSELNRLRSTGVSDIRDYLEERPEFLHEAVELIQVVDVNDAALRLYGANDSAELTGPLLSTVDLEDERTASSLIENVVAIFEGRTYLSRESGAVSPDGSPIDIVIYTFLPREDEMSGYMLVSVIDISEQRRMELDLRRSEERFRSVVEASAQPIVIIDAAGSIIFWNEAAHRSFGYSAREALGLPATAFIPPDVLRRILESADSQSPEATPRSVGPLETFVVTKDGSRIPVEVTLAAWSSDTETCYTAIISDITERKAAEEKLKEQAKLLDIASDAIVVVDIEQKIRYWNKSAERMFGWSAEEALGRVQGELFCSPQHRGELEHAQQVAAATGHWSGQSHYSTKDGRILTGTTRLTLVSDNSGKPAGILSVTSDETDRRALEQELARYQRLDSIGTLAGGIAHDLNNVLTPIVSGVESLAMDERDEKARRTLGIIKSSALRGASVIRQLLDFARGIDGEKSVVDIAATIADIKALILETFPKSVELVLEVGSDVYPIVGEASQIHQVLVNLCVNARDAMPSGGTLTIRARNEDVDEAYARTHVEAEPGPYVVLSVEDTGAGMGPVVLEKIFDPFFTTKETGKGTGLGLATSLSIVRSHGGFIQVSSRPYSGTTFQVFLPASPHASVRAATEHEATDAEGGGETILVADDEEAVLQTTRRILEAHGYHVATAVDGADLIAEFVRLGSAVRLVLTDMAMPHLDGLSAIRSIRKMDPLVPIVAVSGFYNDRATPEFTGLAVNATLSKPFTIDALLQTIRELLNGGEAKR